METEEKVIKPLNGEEKMSIKKARKVLKEHNYKVTNGSVNSFVSLKNINKIYPNGVQAVYNFNLEINQHDFIVLVGPSGCGKSTTLRMIAGLEDISSGYLYIDKILSNYLESKNRDISMVFQNYALYPQMTVFDNIAFPLKVRKYSVPQIFVEAKVYADLLKVFDNTQSLFDAIGESKDENKNKGDEVSYLSTKLGILDVSSKKIVTLHAKSKEDLDSKKDAILGEALTAFNLKKAQYDDEGIKYNETSYRLLKDEKPIFKYIHLNKQQIREKVFSAAEILDLGPYLDRRPKELSGGQMQRVALGRAIVRNAKLFLMDEPLSNLDAKLRVAMRSEIVSLHEKIGATTIYVTHDQTEAMTMATKIVIMSKGWIQQVGTPQEVYSKPKNLFVATFIGSPAMNIFECTYDNGKVIFPNGYEVTYDSDINAIHYNFYKNKIKECERMLEIIDDSHEKAAQEIFTEINKLTDDFANNKDKIIVVLDKILEEVSKIKKDSKARHVNATLQAKEVVTSAKTYDRTVRGALAILSRTLKNIETISPADLGKIHSAQVFVENDESKKEKEVFSYAKRKHTYFWMKWAKKIKQHENSKKAFTYQIGNPRQYVEEMLEIYKNNLIGPHKLKAGIRPEHLHLDDEYKKPTKSDYFKVETGVVELLGNELLVHTNWNNVDVIAKISTGTLVKSHTSINLTMNREKLHLFDSTSGDTIF